MTGMSTSDLGKRITAARCYVGMAPETLADSIGVTGPTLQRIEAGIDDHSESERWALVQATADATRLPIQFFTVDFQGLAAETPPEEKLAQLEQKIDTALQRMDRVVEQAEAQMARGKEQLDRFIQHQQPDRDLLHRIAEHLGVDP